MQVAGQIKKRRESTQTHNKLKRKMSIKSKACAVVLLPWMMRSGETHDQMQETHEQHSPDVARDLKASLLAPALPGPRRSVFGSVGPHLTSSKLELVKDVSPYLPAAEITALWRFIGLHVRLHLDVDVDVHAGSGFRHGEKNSQTNLKNSHKACEETRSWCAVISVNCVVARVIRTERRINVLSERKENRRRHTHTLPRQGARPPLRTPSSPTTPKPEHT